MVCRQHASAAKVKLNLARFFISCKESFIFTARLARYVQDLMQDLIGLAKILARLAYFLLIGSYWEASTKKLE